jgi:signal transduction histidine kinase
MAFREYFELPGRWLTLFLVVAVAPAICLSWLAWRSFEQDRALEQQRIQDRLEQSADLVRTRIERALNQTEDGLPGHVEAPAGGVVVTLSERGVSARPSGRLVYLPGSPAVNDPPAQLFETGEMLEFRAQDYPAAAAEFRKVVASPDRRIQAAALVRLGRVLRKAQRLEDASGVYKRLASLESVTIGGIAAGLLGSYALCDLAQQAGRTADLRRTAAALDANLQSGRWPLDRASYEFYAGQARGWLDRQATQPGEIVALSEAVDWLSKQRERLHGSRGRRSLWVAGQPVLVVWRTYQEDVAAFAVGPAALREWARQWSGADTRLTLTDPEGHRILGETQAGGAIRYGAETFLPWTLRVASANPNRELAQLAARRRMQIAGFLMFGILTLSGVYSIGRAAAREMAVARLKSDFVAAVSHEFRTPLTAMMHMLDLLEKGTIADEAKRRRYYSVLSHETGRLHRLVETLLNFGRMEAGAVRYRRDPLDAAEVVRWVAGEFQQEIRNGHRIEVMADEAAPVRGDREALGRAVWNLVDNAVKYSPDHDAVRVELAREAERVAIRVIDHGIGIPTGEQREIFRKFVRGAASQASSVKGTGIGLALVDHIVSAHGGEIRLESAPGQGSTFTVLLPLRKEEEWHAF